MAKCRCAEWVRAPSVRRMTTELLSTLGDRKRLAVLGALCASPDVSTVAVLGKRTGLSERDVHRALAVLGGAGLVRRDDTGLSADLQPIRSAAAAAVAATPVGRVAAVSRGWTGA